MTYQYRCPQCRAASPPGSRRDAEAYRQTHRDDAHGGLVPEGESIRRVPASTPDPDARYVSSLAVIVLLSLLALASILARLTGH